MGLGQSTIDYNKIPMDWLDVFKSMKITRDEVKKIHDIFDKLDAKQKGGIDIVEWLTLLDLERESFTERVFRAFDKDGNRIIDFYEFVVSLWKFCTLGDEALSVFAFDLYDKNADGVLEVKDVQTLFKELLGAKAGEQEGIQMMAELSNLTETGVVHIDDFREFCRTHQVLLKEVFHLQSRMRQAVLGDKFWKGLATRRIELRKGYNVPISNLMVLHSDRALFKSLMEDRTIMRISSKMKLVLENTDTSMHYRTPESSLDSVKSAKARVIMYKPTSTKKTKRKGRVAPTAPPSDLLHYHNFPY